jgi:hypothetical protein
MSDNEDTPPPLWHGSLHAVHSDVLSVKDAVGPPIPEFRQRPEEGSKIPSSVRRQDAGDVLPDQPFRAVAISNRKVGENEASTWVSKSRPKSGDGERLAGRSSDEKVDVFIRPLLETGHVPTIFNVGKTMRENSRRERLYFRKPRGAPSKRLPRDRSSLDAAAHATIDHCVSSD